MNTTVVIHGSRSGHVVVCTHNNRATKMTFSLPRVCRTIYTDTSMLLYQYAIFVYQQNWILYNCYDPKFKGRLIDRHELSSTQVDLISTVIPSPIYSVSHLNDFVKGLSHLHLSCGPRMETWLKYVKKKWDGKVEVHAHLDWHTDPVTQVLGTIIQDSDHDPWVKMMCARREDTSALRELKALFRCTLLESMKDELFGLQLAERYFRGKMAEAAEGLRDAGVSHVWLRKKLL